MSSQTDYLELIRQRQDHLRQIYFQHESRAQLVFGFAVAVTGALMGSIGGHVKSLTNTTCPWFWVGLAVATTFLMLTFLFALCAVVPMNGRHFVSEEGRLDRWLTSLGFWALGPNSKPAHRAKPSDRNQLETFATDFLRIPPPWTPQPPPAEDGSQPPAPPAMDEQLIETELYRLWSLWMITRRKAGLLRLAICLLAIGLISSLPTYLIGNETLEAIKAASQKT